MGQIHRTRRRVEFRDTDAGGIMHFSTFFLRMEEAEHDLLRSVGLSVVEHDDEGAISWPRVSAECDYRQPIRFEEMLELEVSISRIGGKSITYRHRFLCDGVEIATGMMTAVCCRFTSGRPPESIDIPSRIRERLSPFLEDAAAADGA